MLSAPTILLYFLFGGGVAVALYLTDSHTGSGERIFVVISALIFWPIYLPIILASRSARPPAFTKSQSAKDGMDKAIDQVDAELSKALASLEGWADETLHGEAQRIGGLRHAWSDQAERIREMDRLLAEPERAPDAPLTSAASTETQATAVNDRLERSIELRQQNLDYVRNLRRQAYEELTGSLALVRELVSMIHVASFTGASVERSRELVAQIVEAVEGNTDVRAGEAANDCTF